MKQNYKSYAFALEPKNEAQVIYWIEHNLVNHLKVNPEDQEQIEHIIDYLSSEDAPSTLEKMSYDEAKKNAEKWTKKLMKKGEHIKETDKDTEIVLDFKDGFKIVRLVGKNAYEREGYLMRHCVASYYGSSKEIYSLRDERNMPHCTMEKDQQIKGKGNGNIHPKYVGYVVKFLEYAGMTVGDSEMAHLGYINVEKFKDYLSKDTKYFNEKYVPEDEQLLDKDSKPFASLELFDVKPLVKEINDLEFKLNFELKTFIPLAIDFLFRHKKVKDEQLIADSGYSAQIGSSGDSAQIGSSGDYAQVGSSGDYAKIGSSGYSAQIGSSGNSAKIGSSGNYAKIGSSGYSAQIGSSGYSAKIEASGKDSVVANIGYEGKIKGIIGTWITLAEYDGSDKPLCVKSAQIDGEMLKANTWYILKNGEFTEA